MSDRKNQHLSLSQRILLTLIMLTVAYLFIFMTPGAHRESLQKEITAFKTMATEEDQEIILARAKGYYYSGFIDTGVVIYLERLTIKQNINMEGWWRDHLIRIVDNLKLLFYQASFRFSLFGYWLLIGCPLVISLFADGYYKRRIKQYEFGVASIGSSKIALKVVAISILMIQIYFIFPYAGEYGIYLPPLMFLLIGLMGQTILSNYSKVF